MLDRKDLETAYGRAGRSFNGQLRQNFVVLNEMEQDALLSVNPGPSNSNSRQGQSGRGGLGGRGVVVWERVARREREVIS